MDPNANPVELPCGECHGAGRIILDDRFPENWHECQVCGGHGEVTVDARYLPRYPEDVDGSDYYDNYSAPITAGRKGRDWF